MLGLSSVVLIFQEGTDLLKARQLVQERLATEASRLPAVARPPASPGPVILSSLSSTSRVMKIGMTGKDLATGRVLTQMELTTLAKWTIRPRLMAIPGVANVAIWGQRDKQFQVLVDPNRLRDHTVTLAQVTPAVADATAVTGGGFVDTPNQRVAVRHRPPVETIEDLARAVIPRATGGPPMRIGDVAEVRIGSPPPIGDAVINDGAGLLLIVEKQPQGNTLDVTRNVEKALEQLDLKAKGRG